MEFLRLVFSAVAFVYTKRVGEGDHWHDGKCKIKFTLVASAYQTMYPVPKGMKYIRRKKTDKNWLPVNDRSMFLYLWPGTFG